MSIDLLSGIIDTAKFKVNANGEMTATGGKVGGWNIANSEFNNGEVFIREDGASTIYTVADLIIIRNYIMNIEGYELSKAMIKHYDINKDGTVDARDYVLLQKLIGISME